MPRPKSARQSACKRSSSAPGGSRSTSAVGALLNHEPRACLRNHVRDNVLLMREKARQQRSQREEEAAREKPAFKLRQFENVPSRLYQEPRRSPSVPSRPSSAPVGRRDSENRSPNHISRQQNNMAGGYPQSPEKVAPGWRVSYGLGSLSSPVHDRLGDPVTPPRTSAKTMQARSWNRSFSTPLKSPEHRPHVRKPTHENGDSDDEGGFDIGNFEQVAKHIKQQQGKRISAKDAQGGPTSLQHAKTTPQGPLSHCGEAVQVAVPAGYRLLPDGERQDNLQELQKKLAKLNDQYCRLPLRIETEGQRRQQEMLRNLIKETERAVEVFSRQSVLVEI